MAVSPKKTMAVMPDGTVEFLLWQGRTLRMSVTHKTLADPTGYKARFGLAVMPGEPLLVEMTELDEGVTIIPNGSGGTLVQFVVSDEVTDTILDKEGVWDVVLESPDGQEDTLAVGTWVLWPKVTP